MCVFWTDVFPNLWWGLVVAVVTIWALYIVCPIIQEHIDSKGIYLQEQHRHEKQMKDDAFEREKEWYFIKRTEKSLDVERNLKSCQAELDELKKKEQGLNDGLESLNKEKEQFVKEILKTKIKVYEEIINTIKK